MKVLCCRSQRFRSQRRGAALLATLFITAVTTVVVVSMLQTEMLQFASLRNTVEYDRARYLAEAGVHHALAELESDITWRGAISRTEFPRGSGDYYEASVAAVADGILTVTGTGDVGRFRRSVQVRIKQGG